ncbi:acetyl-CoA carboxylase biotin carboxylase subunit [Actinomadura viridis]|uniref:biotin carboxylase n=1 Tax=Actinomadura viridis TaxID=58110 RepID=A0A931GUX4_9ACTN|nr:biotin carboxylase N-terminal domain-containing protein [Actinomadura viridis]MBG6093634.1 acetyl-CoA carboxylase biotin carboxylase subunit [Actinomadura viridis]
MVTRVLVANRGEIALRVIRACRELGLGTVAVHSAADDGAAHVVAADRAVRIGPAPAALSYLSIPAILEAARITGADAVHPGYGLLSEDPDFAEACQGAGLTFVGPSPEALRVLGDKINARRIAATAGLPVLPGSPEPVASAEQVRAHAARTGYPLILKAAAGGGGRGMEIVRAPGDLAAALGRVRSAAATLFGDDRVFVERCVRRARHVEIQVLGDRHGTVVHLGSRDCSLQRRNQKIVEEAPAPALPADLLDRIAADAVRCASGIGYHGAGTLEFLVEPDGAYWFIEANCRIQVEHPVTEMVTGVDLVHRQLRVAMGEPLAARDGGGPEPPPGLPASGTVTRGCAIECRINAEDPAQGFRPAPGRLTEVVLPAGPFVRVDTHLAAGSAVPSEYDPLLAKVVVWAPDRAGALARMDRALAECRIGGPGIRTNRDFLRGLLRHPRFRDASHDTALLAGLTAGDVAALTASTVPAGPGDPS